MDAFSDDRPEFSGSLISMEFGPGGRIVQLWAADPALPEEGEEFQFVLPPLAYGEEAAEDLYPGTILVSARSNPDDPWVSSRNGAAQHLFDFDDELGIDHGTVSFEYEFPLLPEIQATGRYYEVGGVIPQVCWDVEIRNRSKTTIEIGELAFPLAFNNFYDGFGWSDEQLARLWASRLYIHQFIGGAASWLFAQRMTAAAPGLLVFPGDRIGWEFFNHIPASLNTPHQWEGIPVVYAHSRAVIEREGWKNWSNDHTSLILEPDDSRTFQIRFVPTERDKQDGVFQTLVACGRPAIRLLPSAVAPMDVGIAVEVQGTAPRRFFFSSTTNAETDFDEEGGFCFVRPTRPGPVLVSFEDANGSLSHCHLMFTEPIDSLIKKRAAWIVDHQIHHEAGSPLDKGILLTNYETGERSTEVEEYGGASGIECSLADALFLAEKNAIYPNRREIRALEEYVHDFLLENVQNPGDMSVGSVLTDNSWIGVYAGRPMTYPAVFNLYHSMYRIANTYGQTKERPKAYLARAAQTALAMFRFGWRHYVRTVGILGAARLYELLDDLKREGMKDELAALEPLVADKANQMTKQQYPYAGESVLDTSGFEEVFAAGLYAQNDEHLERTMRCAYASRSLAPSWWWYGSDKRSWDGADSTPLQALVDRGEACLAHTTIPNSLMFFSSLDRDYLALPDAYMRLAFGGMLGPWALVRRDGAASMCYCPDLASRHHGYNPFTGASGLGYYHYLRGAGAYILPNRSQGFYTFGCHLEQEGGKFVIRPWDGVGRRLVFRQIGVEILLGFGQLQSVTIDERKRWIEMQIENPAEREVRADLRIRGLWGRQVQIMNKTLSSVDGLVETAIALPGGRITTVTAKVIR